MVAKKKEEAKKDEEEDRKQNIDTSTTASKDSSEEAVAAAKEKMAAILQAQKEGREIEVDGSLETDEEEVKPKKKQKILKKSDYQVRKGFNTIDHVKVYSPFRVYYDGDADSVSAANLTGPFDILGGHKNFMTLLTPGEIVIRSPRGEERIKMDRGVMQVSQNAVTVFLDV